MKARPWMKSGRRSDRAEGAQAIDTLIGSEAWETAGSLGLEASSNPVQCGNGTASLIPAVNVGLNAK
jgi:hypothetical protein